MAWSLVPLHHDLTTAEGRAALGVEEGDLEGADIARFRARRGEDASCLNLYRPNEPTVLAPTSSFLEKGRFRFQATQAETAEERALAGRTAAAMRVVRVFIVGSFRTGCVLLFTKPRPLVAPTSKSRDRRSRPFVVTAFMRCAPLRTR